jgi:[ribosomal protein S18]-alanine N-acetyltransferase
VQDVEVREPYRRRGVASALCAAAEAEARAAGHTLLRVTVSAESPGAQALYRRLGFADTGTPPRRVTGTVQIRTGPLEVDDTLLVWEKPL